MLRFERINIQCVDWDKVSDFPGFTVFQTPSWLSFVAKTQHAEPIVAALKCGESTVGYFVGLLVRKFGLRILGSPFRGWTTSYMGLRLKPQVQPRLAMEALERFAFQSLRCVHLEVMDRDLTVKDVEGLDFDHNMYSSFEVDLTQTEEQLWENMSSACRRCIRKSGNKGVEIEESHDLAFADDYYAQLEDVFAKRSLVPPYSIDRVRQLIRLVSPTGALLLLRALRSDGRCVATGIFPALNGTMYFWGGASWRSDQILRPNEALQWYAVRYWRQRGIRRYDLGGGGRYKRKYGGKVIQVPWLRKSKSRSIRRMRSLAQFVVRGRQQLLGSWKHKTILSETSSIIQRDTRRLDA